LLWDRLIEKKLGFLLLAYKRREPIAGTIFLYYKEMLTVKYSASLAEYWKLEANNFLYWYAIKCGCENGFNIFDFGLAEITNRNLRDFKSGWGAEEQALTYSSISLKPIITRTGRLNTIVERVIKKSPLWVCRLSGELLYKHFA
jgi:lipid II:glycine glycyltransferase (peptidoglycan interpeptide bridge formation enzyme)